MNRRTSARIIMIIPFVFLMACAIALFFMLTNVKAPASQQASQQSNATVRTLPNPPQLAACLKKANSLEASQTVIDHAIQDCYAKYQ